MSEDIRQNLKSGMIIKVHQKIREKNAKGEEKERIQLYEGMIIAVKHGNGPSSTITVRKMSKGFGVEKIFPLYSPIVDKIEVLKRSKVRRSKLYHIRDKAAKEIRRQMRNVRMVKEVESTPAPESTPETVEETPEAK